MYCAMCACLLYVTLSCQWAEATTPKSTIFNESSTLMYSAITKPNLAIFSQISLILMRILHDKNEQNWFSGFGEICLVLSFRSDRYSVGWAELRNTWSSSFPKISTTKINFKPKIHGICILNLLRPSQIWVTLRNTDKTQQQK